MYHLTSNSLLNSHQWAYCKHHSTETALLYIHDNRIGAIGSQKVSCLCLLYLSAAFDTIDHDLLVTRLSSWFGIHCPVLSWFKSYLTSRSFRVKCETDLSSWYTSSCVVLQGSVLGQLLFFAYTTPLSTLISFCSLNHHLYADDTQLFLSFLPTHLDSSIDYVHNTLDRISNWMTANLLTLNSSNTEFLLIGLSKQLAKINKSSLTTTHSARNIGFIFDKPFTFSNQISSVSKSCYYHVHQLRCIRPYLDTKTASTIATFIVHSKLDYCNSLYYNLFKFQIAWLQQMENSLARAVVKASNPSLRSLHWLKINERIKFKLLSLTYKVLTTTQPLYLCNLITVQPPRSTRSSSLVTLARPSTLFFLRITDRFFQYASLRLWN